MVKRGAILMKFVDRNGNEITAGMYLRFADGSIEKVWIIVNKVDK